MIESMHKRQLHAVGLKATAGRMRLLHLLEKAREPLMAQQIAERLGLNVVTAYRALESLVQAGLVRQGSDGRAAQYSYAMKPHHHHMVCTDCGVRQECVVC